MVELDWFNYCILWLHGRFKGCRYHEDTFAVCASRTHRPREDGAAAQAGECGNAGYGRESGMIVMITPGFNPE